MEIKIRDKVTGIIYSSSISEKNHFITRIDFTTESTDFEVEDRIIDEHEEVSYKQKKIYIHDTSNFKNSVIAAISTENEGEWVNE